MDKVNFYSNIVGKKALDADNDAVGIVRDFVIESGDRFPVISAVVVAVKKEKKKILFSQVLEMNPVKFNAKKDSITFLELTEADALVSNSIIDRQIVDIDGLKVIRVNDVFFSKIDDKFCITHADVGTRGLIRRLGFEKILKIFLPKFKDKLISWEYVEPLHPSRALQLKIPRSKLAELHPADIADLMEGVSHQTRELIVTQLDTQTAAETLVEAEPEVRQSLFMTLRNKRIASIIEKLAPDEAADLMHFVPRSKISELLTLLKPDFAKKVKDLMKYGKETAGGMMSTEFIHVPKEYTAQQVIDFLRQISPSAEVKYYIYVVDEAGKLSGVLSLRDLIIAPPQKKVSEFMIADVLFVEDTATKEDVSKAILKYSLLALPVVGVDGKLVGVVDVEEVLDSAAPKSMKKKWTKKVRRRKKGKEQSAKQQLPQHLQQQNHQMQPEAK